MTPEEVLRQALEARAGSVEVAPDALRSIRLRILSQAQRRRRALAMGLASVATGVAASVAAVVLVVGSCTPATPPPHPPAGTSAPATGATASPVLPRATARLPVYYLGTVNQRLYREFRTLGVDDASLAAWIRAAVTEMLADDPADPDYYSPWLRGTTVLGVRVENGVAVIDLDEPGGPGDPPIPTPLPPPPVAKIMIQQLVWTTTAVAAEQKANLAGVRLLLNGEAVSRYRGATVSGTLTRASAVDTIAPIWLISPQHGDTAPGTFDVHIAGIVPEATLRLRVRSTAGTVVSDRQVMLGAGAPAQGEAHVPLTLAPGTYTLEAYLVSLEDGSEQGLDTHTVTVS